METQTKLNLEATMVDCGNLPTHFGTNASYPVASEFTDDDAQQTIIGYCAWKKIHRSIRNDFTRLYVQTSDNFDVLAADLKQLELIVIIARKSEQATVAKLVSLLRNTLGFTKELHLASEDKPNEQFVIGQLHGEEQTLVA